MVSGEWSIVKKRWHIKYFIIRNQKIRHQKFPFMFKNYFKTAFRNLARNKVYSFINIAGLCIGLACAMLIMLYVKDEVSFDRFHKNVNNIYRIAINVVTGEGINGKYRVFAGTEVYAKHVPGIKSFVRVQGGAEDIKKGNLRAGAQDGAAC